MLLIIEIFNLVSPNWLELEESMDGWVTERAAIPTKPAGATPGLKCAWRDASTVHMIGATKSSERLEDWRADPLNSRNGCLRTGQTEMRENWRIGRLGSWKDRRTSYWRPVGLGDWRLMIILFRSRNLGPPNSFRLEGFSNAISKRMSLYDQTPTSDDWIMLFLFLLKVQHFHWTFEISMNLFTLPIAACFEHFS